MVSLTHISDAADPELPVGYELVLIEKLDSLRSKAQELANKGADEGTLIWALDQTAATARMGKKWICNPGDLHCSLILRPDYKAEEYYQMLIVAVVSLGNCIASCVSPMTALGYQWPNDITIAKHKIASLWLDQGQSSAGDWLIISLSVNVVNSPDGQNFRAMSVSQAQDSTEISSKNLLESFTREFIKQINNWSQRGFKYINDHWRIRLDNNGETIGLQIGAENITGKVKGIDELGNIEIQTDDDGIRKISIHSYMGLKA